ncbi:MAG: flippase [Ignavibacteriales bacterium]|nr:flippase [Ignavibacteriales bacterium]
MFSEKILRLILGFVVGVYMIRYLGPAEFGLLSYAISLVGLFTALATLGLESIVVRELVKNPEKRDELLGSVFAMRLASGVIALVSLAVLLLFTGDDTRTIIIALIIGGGLIFQSLSVIENYFQSKVLAKYSSLVQISNLVITGGLKIYLMVVHANLVWFAVATFLESSLLAVGFLIVFKMQYLSPSTWRFNKDAALKLLKDAWPLILSGIVIMIYMKIAQVFIKNMLDETQNGYYATAVRLTEAWYFIPMAITASLFPAIVSAKNVSEELYRSRLQKLYDVLAWISIGLAIPVTFLAAPVMEFLFGPKYLPAAPVLTVYIWAGVPTFLGVANSQYLIAENLTRMSFYRTLLGMIVNVLLNIYVIPRWGIVGSAWVTLISQTIATFTIATSKRTFHQLGMMLRAIFFIDLFIIGYNLWQKRR